MLSSFHVRTRKGLEDVDMAAEKHVPVSHDSGQNL
jgi:hypothetical protein